LESGTFELPGSVMESNCTVINWPELVMMVQGISLQHIRTRKRYLLTNSC
jgi:hypothetical protein